jgi:hypothetical protein
VIAFKKLSVIIRERARHRQQFPRILANSAKLPELLRKPTRQNSGASQLQAFLILINAGEAAFLLSSMNSQEC